MGTYIGHHYLGNPQNLGAPQTAVDFSNDRLFKQSWLHGPQPGIPPTPIPSNSHLADTIPWLLYHHDDQQTRHHELARHLASAPCKATTTMTAVLYILGDCLEWLMQGTPFTQLAQPLLCRHLQRDSVTYPAPIGPQVNRLIAALESNSLVTNDYQSQDPDVPIMALAAAIQRALTYPENLALALNTGEIEASIATSIPTVIGCLLGAWRGTSVIPNGWIMSLPQTSRQTLTHGAEHLYRNWAGILHISATFEAFPLDL